MSSFCRQLTNKKFIHKKYSALLASFAIKKINNWFYVPLAPIHVISISKKKKKKAMSGYKIKKKLRNYNFKIINFFFLVISLFFCKNIFSCSCLCVLPCYCSSSSYSFLQRTCLVAQKSKKIIIKHTKTYKSQRADKS